MRANASGIREVSRDELQSVAGGIWGLLVGYLYGKILDKNIESGENGGVVGAYCTGMKNNGATTPLCP